MVTINDWLDAATNKFASVGIDSARLDALILLENTLDAPRESLLARPNFEISNDDEVTLGSLVKRRAKLEPVAYLTGHKEFYSLDFLVNKNVLVPRPETEAIVEHILDTAKQKTRILDVGTGSGVIAISLKHNRNDLEVSASEISDGALKVARANAAKHDVFIGFVVSDLFIQISPKNQYNIVAANLPYVALDKISEHPELAHEPALALFPDDSRGLSIYEKFFRGVGNYLTDDGYVIIEHDPSQFEDLLKLGKIARFTGESISPFVTKFSHIQTRNISIK